ncbi:hypothetical protein GCM10010472_11000 [Pseudonocardia halophobica]|uniref:Helix-turn-helix domain-containing protein n=1 Tax=Pseudonocardia halophobica TaxID=29401 RepID=A0A9W6L4G7_9PSEU|nr:helix-turn-helix domain-containing protein [Pseudonocardia halophobica]GLL13487.1 hypothetical protein GCM10017577_46310 [Pseudonocardia halophobica]
MKSAGSAKSPLCQDPLHGTLGDDPDRLIDTRQLAILLDCDEQTVRALVRRGNGPARIRVTDRVIRYRVGAVREWLDQRTERAA